MRHRCYKTSSKSVGFKGSPAITFRSVSAILFGAAIVQPIIIYLTLTGAQGLITLGLIGFGGGFGMSYSMSVFLGLGGQILWLVVLFWTFLTKSFGRVLSKEETFIIYTFYPVTVGTALLFISPIFNLYVANSYPLQQLGLAQFIPPWWAPRGLDATEAYLARSLFSGPMLVPVGLGILVLLFGFLCDIGLGIFAYQRFAVVEKLDFPAQTAWATGINTIAVGEPEKRRFLMIAMFLGLLYGTGSWLIPTVTGIGILSLPPRGVADFTFVIETKLPGAVLGFDLTWMSFAAGFVVPLRVLIPMAITGLLAYTIGNNYLVTSGIWPDWAPNYGIGWDWSRSNLYWWISVIIGLSVAAAIVPIALHPGRIVRAITALRGSAGESSGRKGYVMFLPLISFFASSLAAVALFHILVPDFPLWILLVSVLGFSFFGTVVGAYSAGVTYGGFWVPYLKESIIYYSGYTDPQAWFGRDFMMVSIGGIGHSGNLKMASLCGVSMKDYVVGYVFAVVIGVAFGFFYVSMFWNTAPIPSYTYPYTVSGWPIMALETGRWVKWLWTGILFKTDVILYATAIGSIIAVASDIVFHAPWLLISIVTGLTMLPSIAISQLIGGVVSKILETRFRRETWNANKGLVVVGLAIGDGVALALGSGMMVVFGSMWVLPY